MQLCYRALPQYESIVRQRQQNIPQNLQQMSADQKLKLKDLLKKLLGTKIQRIPRNEDEITHLYKQVVQGKSQPVPIMTEDELAHLYLQEFYKDQASCDITELDIGAILNILAKASCFTDSLRKQAATVRDKVRNKWAHVIIEDWNPTKMNDAFKELKKLAQALPGNSNLLKELDEDFRAVKQVELGSDEYELIIDNYKTSVKNGEHKKVEEKIKKLGFGIRGEIFLERRFQKKQTRQESSIGDDG